MYSNKRLKIALVVSVVLHVLIFLFWSVMAKYHLFATEVVENSDLQENPIVFEFEQNKPKTVIETPDDANTTEPEQADYLSDKNALARNEDPSNLTELGDPYARGDFRVPELPTASGPAGEPGQPAEQTQQSSSPDKPLESEDEDSEALLADRSVDFKKDYLVRSPQSAMSGASQNNPKVRYDNRSSRAPDMGGLSFNTYDWDFAPYMLTLKKKVEGNIFPPPAFTRLGLISGETLLRFKIYPNGELRDLEILDYQGHKTLMETSVRAIEVSAPFMKLPADFPEKYLEVTAKFSYFIKKLY